MNFQNLPDAGAIDILILNAGKTQIESMFKLDLKSHQEIFHLNYFSALAIIQNLLPMMPENALIAGISTIGVFRGVCGAAPYFASKSAFNVMLESYRLELLKKEKKIFISIINPGFIKTKMSDGTLLPHSFEMEAEVAAKKIIRAIVKKKKTYAFPFPMRVMTFFNRILPDCVFDFLNSRISKL